jgi:large subunit ribosomal protein L6
LLIVINMNLKKLESIVEIPADVDVSVKGHTLTFKGKKGEMSRAFLCPQVKVTLEGKKLSFSSTNATKREKKMIYSFTSHAKNLIFGVTNGHHYRLKICSGHFPMTAALSGKDFIVKNFLGEKFPRKLALPEKVTVKIEGDFVAVESCSKEFAGQTAANIELLTKIRGRDPRIFQDGIWIIQKDGKDVK